jgi:hypothetical protein
MVTDAIPYEEDATFVYMFLREIGRGPYSRLGVDIGPSQTFRSTVEKTPDVVEKMELMIERYATSAYLQMEERRKWSTNAKNGLLLRFIVDTHMNTFHRTHDGAHEDEPTAQAYVVLSYPLNHIHNIFSRGTRVCLAISEVDFGSGNFTTSSLRTLKLSWQSATRQSELTFYEEAIVRNGGRPIKHLLKAIAGASLISTLQRDGRFI